MITRIRKFDLAVMAGCLTLLSYLVWHGLYGQRNFAHRDALLAQVAALDVEHRQVQEERQKLDGRVSLMRPESIDPDLLDELARRSLNFAKGNELILIGK